MLRHRHIHPEEVMNPDMLSETVLIGIAAIVIVSLFVLFGAF